MQPTTVPPPEACYAVGPSVETLFNLNAAEYQLQQQQRVRLPTPVECFPYVLVMQMPSLHQELMSKPYDFVYCYNCRTVLVCPKIPDPSLALFTCRSCMNCLFDDAKVQAAQLESQRINVNVQLPRLY